MINNCTIEIEGFRKLPNPYSKNESREIREMECIVAIVDINNLPDNFPTKTNPREQNMNTKVAHKIKEGLESEELCFHILNRGILISAKEVKYKAPNKLEILFADENFHGIVDGGHTYRSIIENRKNIDKNKKQYVKLEILVGIETIFEDVAAARNTSVQVKDSAIAELKQKFQIIKTAIDDTPFFDNIAYKENEDKDIEVEEILSILYMFNLEKNNSIEKISVSPYSSKNFCQKEYVKAYDAYEDNIESNPYFKMKNIMKDIFELHDYIEENMGKKYKESVKSGKYGSVKGVDSGKVYSTKFYSTETEYKSPKGFIYPILASFRALIREKNGIYEWIINPKKCFDNIGSTLVFDTVERSRTLGNNPNAVGKDSGHWKQLYNTVDIYALRNHINE